MVLFGSTARGESTQASDVDLLIVLRPNTKIERQLYRTWDEMLVRLNTEMGQRYSPQFVTLPKNSEDAGGLWFEAALDGQILWQSSNELTRCFRSIRSAIAEGRMKRRMSHGHPYWERATTSQILQGLT